MTNFEKDILAIIKESDGIKASEIALKLNCEKSAVNSALSGPLGVFCYQNNSYKWYYEENYDNEISVDFSTEDKDLSSLCKYYLNCLSLEQSHGISASVKKNSAEYICIKNVTSECFMEENVSDFVRKASQKHSTTAYIGYPIELFDVFSKKHNCYFKKMMPIFLFQIDYDLGKISTVNTPFLNTEVVNKYSNQDAGSLIYDVIALEEELGLNNPDADFDVEDLVARLQNIRQWDWKENINPYAISFKPALEDITENGIYNKAVIIASERSPFTQGLESELKAISEFSETKYLGTALYNWIHPETLDFEKISDEEKVLLEVLPLNSEQETAVQKALSSDLTILTGPPGTGKSQVVTEILINAAWQGKTVLFASKNNKAVDVVEQRINGLADKPILFRLGSDSVAHHFATIAEGMLSKPVQRFSRQDFEKQKIKYADVVNAYKSTKKNKNDFISLRNALDSLEQKYCVIRELMTPYYDLVSENDADEIKVAFEAFKKSFLSSQKEEQALLTRLFWPLYKNKRAAFLLSETENLNSKLIKYDVSVNADNLSDEVIGQLHETVDNLLNRINLTVEYRSLLEDLKAITPIEDVDKTLIGYKHNLAEMAADLWKNWLSIREINISPDLRKEVSQYLAAMKLIGGGSLSDYPDLLNQFKALQQKLSRFLPCWAVTSLSAKGRVPFEPGFFDIVVIDEASQCDIASIIPLLYRAKTAVIIGDSKQLSHITTVSNKQDISLIQKYNIGFDWSYVGSSLYDKAIGIANSENIISLRDHHRSYGDIINFSNSEFYEGNLRVATNYDKLVVPENTPLGIMWKDVSGVTERPLNGGALNKCEAEQIIKSIRKFIYDKSFIGTVGVVTPFKAQAEYIRNSIDKEQDLRGYLYEHNDFWVDTVHKFQGDERDVIFFSPVISDGASSGAITFLKNTGNLFNVAITRARSSLIIIGNMAYCSNCEVPYLEHFVDYVKRIHNNTPIENISITDYGRRYPKVQNIEQVSDWEKLFYTALYDKGIIATPQYSVDKYKLDLVIIDGERKLDIEVDGELYHSDWNGELCYRDQLRNQRLYELGWDVKRFWVYQIRDDLNWCIKQVQDWLNI